MTLKQECYYIYKGRNRRAHINHDVDSSETMIRLGLPMSGGYDVEGKELYGYTYFLGDSSEAFLDTLYLVKLLIDSSDLFKLEFGNDLLEFFEPVREIETFVVYDKDLNKHIFRSVDEAIDFIEGL